MRSLGQYLRSLYLLGLFVLTLPALMIARVALAQDTPVDPAAEAAAFAAALQAGKIVLAVQPAIYLLVAGLRWFSGFAAGRAVPGTPLAKFLDWLSSGSGASVMNIVLSAGAGFGIAAQQGIPPGWGGVFAVALAVLNSVARTLMSNLRADTVTIRSTAPVPVVASKLNED